MAQEIPRGRFVWFDLMTTDSGASIDFYTKVLGWGTDVWSAGAVRIPPCAAAPHCPGVGSA